jgi:hypothetical protein
MISKDIDHGPPWLSRTGKEKAESKIQQKVRKAGHRNKRNACVGRERRMEKVV